MIFYMVGAAWCGRKTWIQATVLTSTRCMTLDGALNFNKLHFFKKNSLTVFLSIVLSIRNHNCKTLSTVPGK